MTENMPQEIEAKYIIPAIRREFAKILISQKGYSQKKAAQFLDITEAAVSQYLHAKRGVDVEFDFGVAQEIKKSIAALQKNYSKPALIGHLHRICRLTSVKKIICSIHRAQSADLDDCTVCFDDKLIQIKQ